MALGSGFAGRLVIVDDANPEKITITLARAIPEKEAWLYENEEALGQVRRGLAQARERRFSKTPPDIDADGDSRHEEDGSAPARDAS